MTRENIEAARQRWAVAGIRDYDLEYTTAPANGHFLVTVREGVVKKVEGIGPGGARNELHPGAPRYYSVDGIFTTIADELAQLSKDNAFRPAQGHHDCDEVQDEPGARLYRVVSPRHHGHISRAQDRHRQAHTFGRGPKSRKN